MSSPEPLTAEAVERAARIQRDRIAGALAVREIAPVREIWSFDNEDDSLLVKRIQDCAPFLDRNHQIREHGSTWRGVDNDFWKVASIPNLVIEQWLLEGIDVFDEADWPKVKARLNGDYKYLKTAPVRV